MKLSDFRRSDNHYEGLTAVLPWGTVERHGPHLSNETDTWIARAVCETAERERSDKILLMPVIPYGESPDKINISYRTMRSFFTGIADSLYKEGVRELIVAGAHGGNNQYMTGNSLKAGIVKDLKNVNNPMNIRYVDVLNFNPTSDGGYHANETETSMMLYIAELYNLPDLVDMSKACKWENGVDGDATLATVENGKEYFEEMVEVLVKAIDNP